MVDAHKRGVRTLAIDPNRQWFVSGSAHGDVKVCWAVRRLSLRGCGWHWAAASCPERMAFASLLP